MVTYRYIKISDITDSYLQEGPWLEEGEGEEKGDVIWSYTEGESGWTAEQIWGFQMVEGARKHVRRIVSKKGKEEHKVRLVYDYKPSQ